MKVVHLIHSFPPRSFGGTETYVRNLARCQAANGLDAIVFSGSNAEDELRDVQREIVDGVPVRRIPWRGWHGPGGRSDAVRRHLEQVIENDRPDVVHVHHWHNLTSDAVWVSRARGVPAVVSVHDFYATCPRFHRLRDRQACEPDLPREACVECVGPMTEVTGSRLHAMLGERESIFRRELTGAAAVLVLSADERQVLERIPWLHGVSFRVCPLPAPELAVHATGPGVATGPGLRLVSWGGLDPGKGIHVLAAACAMVSRPEQLSLDHYGRVLDEDYAVEVTALSGSARLTLHGAYTPDIMLAEFPSYDIAVFPSLYRETHGIVVDEAAALGLPVLVSDRGAPPSRIGARGLTFPAGDARALARALESLAGDRNTLARLRAGAARPQPRMTEHCAELHELYREAIDRQGRAVEP